ncbi:MAG TPA: hypothetical protein VFB00_05700 [Terriglobales bacterium]|nr:hypothetical protein [Terriglobales bacterium]
MERQTILIISDQPGFAGAITSCWMAGQNAPAFALMGSAHCCNRPPEQEFDLAIAGGLDPELRGPVLQALQQSAKPVVYISNLNGHSPKGQNLICLPETEGWAELAVAVAKEVFKRVRSTAELMKLAEANAELERQAALGRYMLDVRHNLNNALTSILGNSDLILLEQPAASPKLLTQVETIRNMSLRMNEILTRFSSLQKEMQLVEQHRSERGAKRSPFAGQ